MRTTPDLPYQDLPSFPPSADIETPAVFKATLLASRALARLDGACKRLPDPTMLINLIPLMEAQASNEIENIVTTQDELFRAANGALSQLTPQVKEALRYREALHAGFKSIEDRPITTQTAVKICSRILNHQQTVREKPGTFIGNRKTQQRIYTPPEGKEVILQHLKHWEDFIHGDHGIDPLIVMAMAHYQFEAIHPFTDGNGRTGRVLNMLMLIQSELLELPILYLSGHIMRNKNSYYERLNAVTTKDDWEGWILFMLAGIESTAKWTLNIIDTTDKLRSEMETQIRELNSKLPAGDLTRLLFTQPYLRIENVVEAGLAQRQTAGRWLNEIANSNIIHKETVGRASVYTNSALLNALFTAELPD